MGRRAESSGGQVNDSGGVTGGQPAGHPIAKRPPVSGSLSLKEPFGLNAMPHKHLLLDYLGSDALPGETETESPHPSPPPQNEVLSFRGAPEADLRESKYPT